MRLITIKDKQFKSYISSVKISEAVKKVAADLGKNIEEKKQYIEAQLIPEEQLQIIEQELKKEEIRRNKI